MPTIKRRNVLTLLPLTAMGLGLAACADNPKNAKGGASGSGAAKRALAASQSGRASVGATAMLATRRVPS